MLLRSLQIGYSGSLITKSGFTIALSALDQFKHFHVNKHKTEV